MGLQPDRLMISTNIASLRDFNPIGYDTTNIASLRDFNL
jgi:hypothetical protein